MDKGKILYEESDEHYKRRKNKTFYRMIFFLSCGVFGIIFIVLSIYLLITKWDSEDILFAIIMPFYSIFLLFLGEIGFTTLKDYIKGRFQDKLIIYETGISFLDSSDKEFIPFETIEDIKFKKISRRKEMLEIILKDGTKYVLGSQFRKILKFVNKIISANY